MGVFKDAKDGIKGAKELGDYHGGMPSIRGSFKDIAALSDDQGQGEILKVGTPAKARGEGIRDAGRHRKFTMGIELDVFPPEGASRTPCTTRYPTARRRRRCRSGWKSRSRSSRRPDGVAVQWDALKGSIAAAGGDMNVAMQGIQNTYAGTADAAGRAVPRGAGGGEAAAAPPAAARTRPSGSRR